MIWNWNSAVIHIAQDSNKSTGSFSKIFTSVCSRFQRHGGSAALIRTGRWLADHRQSQKFAYSPDAWLAACLP
jgi:hypothetical protein